MKILISLSSEYGKTTEQKVEELNNLITDVVNSTLYPTVEVSNFFLAMTQFLYSPNKPSVLNDAIFAAQNLVDSAVSEKRRYPADRTYEQDLSYKAFAKLKSELKKFKPLSIKDAKKQLAFFDRLAGLNNAAQSLVIHKFDPSAKHGHNKTLRDTLEREGIFYAKEEQ